MIECNTLSEAAQFLKNWQETNLPLPLDDELRMRLPNLLYHYGEAVKAAECKKCNNDYNHKQHSDLHGQASQKGAKS